MKYKSGQPMSEQQIQMHNEKIAAMLTQAFLGQPNSGLANSPQVVRSAFVLFLDLLNEGEL